MKEERKVIPLLSLHLHSLLLRVVTLYKEKGTVLGH